MQGQRPGHDRPRLDDRQHPALWVDPHCIHSFGPYRTMFATNWPVCVLYGSYLRQVDAYRLILEREGFSREDQEKMLYRNAERLYRI